MSVTVGLTKNVGGKAPATNFSHDGACLNGIIYKSPPMACLSIGLTGFVLLLRWNRVRSSPRVDVHRCMTHRKRRNLFSENWTVVGILPSLDKRTSGTLSGMLRKPYEIILRHSIVSGASTTLPLPQLCAALSRGRYVSGAKSDRKRIVAEHLGLKIDLWDFTARVPAAALAERLRCFL